MPTKFFDPTPHDKRVLQELDNPTPIVMAFMDEQSWHMWRGGRIIEVDDSQVAIDFASRKPRYFVGTNSPIPLLLVTVQTDEREPGRGYDTGLRRIYIPKSDLYVTPTRRTLNSRYGALVAAMEQAGCPGELPAIGGALWMMCCGTNGEGPKKIWDVRYETP